MGKIYLYLYLHNIETFEYQFEVSE